MDIKIQNRFTKLDVPPSIRGARNSIAEIILLLIVGGLFYWFIISPKVAQVTTAQAELAKAEAQRKQVETDVSTLKDLSSQLDTHKEEISHLDQALPLSERQIRSQMLLEKLVSSSGALVGSVSVASVGDAVVAGNRALLQNPFGVKRTLTPLNVTVSVSGSFSQLMDLIKKLENYGRIMDISSLSLSAGEDEKLDLTLNLNTYYFGP